jgi:hypothetical protein
MHRFMTLIHLLRHSDDMSSRSLTHVRAPIVGPDNRDVIDIAHHRSLKVVAQLYLSPCHRV